MAAVKPGFSADGTFIENPTALLEATVPGLLGAARAANAAKKAPLFNEILNLSETGNLGEYPTKSFQKLPILNLSRVSSSGAGNNCWFDSFLQCMSPKYRSLDLDRRRDLRRGFRTFISQTLTKSILAQKPSFLLKEPFEVTDEKFTSNIQATGTEIEWLNGFLIAWYFGVNLIYIRRDRNGILQIACETSYQSPDCKAIIINHNGNHFEPVGKVVLGADKKLVEGDSGSKFLFSWSDKELCSLKELNTMCHGNKHINSVWTQPTACEAENVSKARAEAGKLKPNQITLNKSQAGEKRAELLERIEKGNTTALDELVEMGKKEAAAGQEPISFLSLKPYMNTLKKRNDWNTVEPIFVSLEGGRRKRRTMKKRRSTKRKLATKSHRRN